MDARNYMREFISATITVEGHSNPLYVSVNGLVVDETARTFKVEVDGKIKTIPKITGKFRIVSNRFDLTVKGNSILMRPEERLKNLRKIIKQENKGDDYN